MMFTPNETEPTMQTTARPDPATATSSEVNAAIIENEDGLLAWVADVVDDNLDPHAVAGAAPYLIGYATSAMKIAVDRIKRETNQ